MVTTSEGDKDEFEDGADHLVDIKQEEDDDKQTITQTLEYYDSTKVGQHPKLLLKAKFHPQQNMAGGQEYGTGEPLSLVSGVGLTSLRNEDSCCIDTIESVNKMDEVHQA